MTSRRCKTFPQMASARLKPPSCSVFFGNLHPEVTDKHLLELGVQAGPVLRAQRTKDSVFGFVEYADVESAIYCVTLYHGLLKLFGQAVNVNFSNQPVTALGAEEQKLQEKCNRLLDLVLSTNNTNANSNNNAAAGAVRRGGREAQRYAPYGDARGHREQRAAARAPTRWNDDESGQGRAQAQAHAAAALPQPFLPPPQQQQPRPMQRRDAWKNEMQPPPQQQQQPAWPGAAAQPPPYQHQPQPLDAGAVAAMQAAAAAAAAGLAVPQQQQVPSTLNMQGHQFAPQQQQVQAAWQVPNGHSNVQQPAQVVVMQQQQPQQPAYQQQPVVQESYQPAYQQPQQQYQAVQHAPQAYNHQQQYQVAQQAQPHWQQPQQQVYQQWQQPQQQHYQAGAPQVQLQQHHSQFAQPAVSTPSGGFQSSMPGALLYQAQAMNGQQAPLPPQQQQQQTLVWLQ